MSEDQILELIAAAEAGDEAAETALIEASAQVLAEIVQSA